MLNPCARSMDLLDEVTAGPAHWTDRRRAKAAARMKRQADALVVHTLCVLRKAAMVVSRSQVDASEVPSKLKKKKQRKMKTRTCL